MSEGNSGERRLDAAEVFDEHRGLLVSVAYRILGSVTDAEDAVQEAWLRWSGVDHSEVNDPRAFLVRVTTRLAIDRLRRAKTRRESYVGPWLPEPILTRQDLCRGRGDGRVGVDGDARGAGDALAAGAGGVRA